MWDPHAYLKFADQRSRPFHDLMARIGAESPRKVVDLGCGPGNLTELMAQRWPGAKVEAVDMSPEMVAQAKDRGIDAKVADLRDWRPDADTDVLVSCSALQWLPSHPELIRNWLAELPDGAWFGMHVPAMGGHQSFQLLLEQANHPRWSAEASGALFREDLSVGEPVEYAEILADAGVLADVWEATYLLRLHGDDPILDWLSASALVPIRSALGDERWRQFRAELAPKFRAAYPQRADGSTWWAQHRIFAVAHKP